MLFEILQVIYFMLPAYAATIAPVFANKISFLNFPVDFGYKLGKCRLFGKNKTYRGFFFGTIAALMVALAQANLYQISAIRKISLVDYNNPALTGFILGFGALFGDLVKSFFKRRQGIREGVDWIPYDQADFVIGTFVLGASIMNIAMYYWLINIIISPLLHFIVVRISILHKIR
ncbi:MAG: CDP-archaeol synthase [archaeon]